MEIVVIDSGSEENEETIAVEFQRQHANLVYQRSERETLYAAWNRAAQIARGKYLVNANTDDGWRTDAFEVLAEALDENSDADLAYSHCAWTNVVNDTFGSGTPQRTITYPNYHPALTLFYCLTGCLQFWRASSLKKLGGFDAALEAVGDFEILNRLAKTGMKALLVPEVLSLFYQNAKGITQQSTTSQREEMAVRNRARSEINISHYFKTDSEQSEALAWATLGTWAAGCPIPWLDEPVYDGPFALQCFEQASCLAPGNPGIIHNLIIELTRAGKRQDAEVFLCKLASGHARALREALRRKDFLYAEFKAEPAAGGAARTVMQRAVVGGGRPAVRSISNPLNFYDPVARAVAGPDLQSERLCQRSHQFPSASRG